MSPNKFYTAVSVILFVVISSVFWYLSKDFKTAITVVSVFWMFQIGLSLFSLLLAIKVPFVTDIIKEPKTPVYKYSNGIIYKYVVGYSNENVPAITILFPLSSFFSYKTMVEEDSYWLTDRQIQQIESESKTLEQVVSEIQEEEKHRESESYKYQNLIKRINKDYEDNFIT